MKIIPVKTTSKSYQIIIGDGIVKNLPEFINAIGLSDRLAVIITNRYIYRLWKDVVDLLKSQLNAQIIFVPDGEQAKTEKHYFRVVSKISKLDKDRKSVFIIAIGGGVIGDLSGFVAGTYRRGVPILQVPTTLLAQIDSSIGGKTAINLETGKNLVGVYHQPDLVVIDTNFLTTLKDRQIREGLAEAVKYGVIKDARFFSYLENSSQIDWQYLVYNCALIKAEVVSKDEREQKGLRFILNFGHTFGHAIEMAGSYSAYSHGEAVSIGMVCAAQLAVELGLCSEKTKVRIENLLDKFSLPIFIDRDKIDFKRFWKALNRDKKFIGGRSRFILPRRIGKVEVIENIERPFLEKVIIERRKDGFSGV